ncbi:Fe-S oxidoreductase [Halococcus saccharolyticus DSM 5350]|uniref:Fe-S oxidoreductase n=1 Tax=Halococcus saccharolyticus DSM 5350 TaxID=1227455 RepID=M0ML32_9EURY|nr:Fe-S oxidoreductase [Halococcus saccharolyticus DSM 5350]
MPRNPREIDTTQRPFVLIWEVTQACDLACKHCRADAHPQRDPDELTTAEGKELLDDVRAFGDGQLVVLSGGDPLARDDTTELVDYGTDNGLRMTLTPSGTTSLTADRIQTVADAGLRRMALSIDGGSATTHDELRQERGSFDQTLQAARDAQAAGLPIQINTTVCAETVDELPAIRDLVADLGAVLWSVFFLVPIGRGRVLDPISPDRAERVLEWLCTVSDEASFGIKTTEAPHYRRVAIERDRADHATRKPAEDGIGRRLGITAGNGFAFINHTGEVYPSGFLPETAGTSNTRVSSTCTENQSCSKLFETRTPSRASAARVSTSTFAAGAGRERTRTLVTHWQVIRSARTRRMSTMERFPNSSSPPERLLIDDPKYREQCSEPSESRIRTTSGSRSLTRASYRAHSRSRRTDQAAGTRDSFHEARKSGKPH